MKGWTIWSRSHSHDIGFMHCSDPATTFLPSQLKRILSNPEGIAPGDDLQTLHYPRYTLRQKNR